MYMPLMDKQRREIDTRRPNYAVFKRRRRIGLLVLVILAALVLGSLGAYLFSGTSEETSQAPPEQVDEPAVEETPEETPEEQAAREQAAKEQAAKEEEERKAAIVPDDPTLFLTVPKLGVYGHTVRNDDSEFALDLGAIKLPDTGFPWQKQDTNTYIACHRLGWPGNESYHQCLNLPVMQEGDEITLSDTLGRVYKYRVFQSLQVTPEETWVKKPIPGKDVVSLQSCIETIGDVWNTVGPNWTARYIVQAERVN
jgi:sortase A